LKQKYNVEVKVEYVMRNEPATNHSPTPLFEEKQMQALDVEEMDSSLKIDLRDVSWWLSIKDACRPRVTVLVKFSKEGCISLATGDNNNSFKIDML